MKRFFALLLVILLAAGMMPGCLAAEENYPLVLTDQAGRNVTIESVPESIASAYYIATSMLIALGQADQITGIENDAHLRPVYALSAPHLNELPAIGTVKLLDIEACAALNPDLLVLPLGLKDHAEMLDTLGITAVFINPESPSLQAEAISLLGAATGSSLRAESLLNFIENTAADLQTALTDVDHPSVYLSGNSSYLKTAGPAMYQHSLVENAGGTNAAAALTDNYWAEISYEQLLAWNPEYIFTASGCKYSPEDILQDENLRGLDAVENGCVYSLPGFIENWDSPVPGSILGSLYMAHTLHPESFPMENYESAVREFYETFYGFTPEF